MRVTTTIWVSAHIRRVQAAGAIATIVCKGALEAGAIYVIVHDLQGNFALYGPAPQSDYGGERVSERLFECILPSACAEDVEEKIARERDFDPDVWVVEVEDRAGRPFVEIKGQDPGNFRQK